MRYLNLRTYTLTHFGYLKITITINPYLNLPNPLLLNLVTLLSTSLVYNIIKKSLFISTVSLKYY